MRKYIIAIISIGIVLMLVLAYNVMKIEKSNIKVFKESGYILQSTSADIQKVERYYFTANEDYKEEYNDNITFLDTNGNKVITSNLNFVHYTNGSVSALKNGVLIDLNAIEIEPICYYNMPKEKFASRNGKWYTITNLDKNLQFENLLWKIGENKYLIASEKINLVFDDNTTKEINGYIEFEYIDNEIVKIYNQEIAYQTISSKVYIEIPNGIKINLSNRIISKNDDNKMSFSNMVIDSEDNVTIVDLTIEEEKEKDAENEIGGNTASNIAPNYNIVNGQNPIIGNINGETPSDEIIDENEKTINEPDDPETPEEPEEPEEPKEPKIILQPTFIIEDFKTSSLGISAHITINDEQNLLSSDTVIKILNSDTNKVVYEREESQGVYNIDLDIASLFPDTEYILQVEAAYKVDDISYRKNFIFKTFRTNTVAMDFEKDAFTDTSLRVKVTFEKNSKVKMADVTISDIKDNVIETAIVYNESTEENKSVIEFGGLTSNTEYRIRITNIVYDGEIISNGFELNKTFMTLKAKPEMGETEYEINKRDSKFIFRLKNIVDKDASIQNYRFEVHDVRIDEKVYSCETKITEAIINVDEITIFRNVGYTFKVVAIVNDNEKQCEYESEFSDVITMDGEEFPTVRFEQKEVTFERVEGTIIVEDKGNTISLDSNNEFTIIYTDSVGTSKSFTAKGSLKIPVLVNNLRANETYKFAVYTKVDLQDENDPIDQCYIGGVIVKTEKPQNMVANFTSDIASTKNTFNVLFQLTPEDEDQGTLEAETLTGMTFSIYPGQTENGALPTGAATRTVKMVDTNEEAYKSTLKDKYCDTAVLITPAFFGSQNKDFKERFYTIVVSEAYDYTEHENTLPIINNVITVATNGYMPETPDSNSAIDVTVIRNRDLPTPRLDLDATTVVGYKLKAIYDNSGLYARKIKYNVHTKTGQLLATKTLEFKENGDIPTATFELKDGINAVDSEMRRGNTYYFTYEVEMDLNNDGEVDTTYPVQEKGKPPIVLKSEVVEPLKQTPKITMYPAVSDETTYTFNYKITDIDYCLQEQKFTAKINNKFIDEQQIEETKNDFARVTFKKLTLGNLTISYKLKLLDTLAPTDVNLINQYFEKTNSVADVKCRITLDQNKVLITLLENAQLDNIVAIKAIFSAEGRKNG